jgi:P-type Ca2+ transporter type 2B
LITEQFEDKILRILCGAALISLVIGILTEGIELGWIEGFAIFIAVFIIVSVTAVNNYLKEKQFRKLYAQVEERKINVKRNGKIESLSIHDVLVGDIIIIETGEIFPVDGILVHGNSLSVDESSMTGESDLIHKLLPTPENPKTNPFLISGSKVIEGTGEMIVIAVGKHSFLGKQKLMLQEDKEETPLQQKLAVIADDIGKLGMFSAGSIFIAMIIHMIAEAIYYERSIIDDHTLKFIIDAFILAITIIVVAVPEGLPLAVTISLAYSVEKMRLENNLVRYLEGKTH